MCRARHIFVEATAVQVCTCVVQSASALDQSQIMGKN